MLGKVIRKMKERHRHRLFALFGASILLNSLPFGFLSGGLSQSHADVSTVQTGDLEGDRPLVETEDKTQAPRGQTFYKYTDEEGNLYFTDDLAKVPEHLRDRIEILEISPLPIENSATTGEKEQKREETPPPSSPIVIEREGEHKQREEASGDASVYKEIPFDQFIHIRIGMDEAEVISRLGFPSFITPSDYFHGERARYRFRIVRLIYLGNRDLNQKTTVIEIRNGKVVNIERIFPF